MKQILPVMLVILLLLTACGGENAEQNTYRQVTQDEAKKMMDEQDAVILDVREQNEAE